MLFDFLTYANEKLKTLEDSSTTRQYGELARMTEQRIREVLSL